MMKKSTKRILWSVLMMIVLACGVGAWLVWGRLAQSAAWLVGFNLNAKCDTELENLCVMVENRQI